MKRRLLDLFGLLLVGDGILTLISPKRHCLLWEVGPDSCRKMVDEFVEHPVAARWAGLAEAVIGLALAEQQMPRLLAWSRRCLS